MIHREGFSACKFDSTIKQRFICDNAVHFDTARSGEDEFRFCVINAGCQFVSGEPAEDNRMNGANPSAGKHGDNRFRHHRHVDNHPIAFLNALIDENTSKTCDLVS